MSLALVFTFVAADFAPAKAQQQEVWLADVRYVASEDLWVLLIKCCDAGRSNRSLR